MSLLTGTLMFSSPLRVWGTVFKCAALQSKCYDYDFFLDFTDCTQQFCLILGPYLQALNVKTAPHRMLANE